MISLNQLSHKYPNAEMPTLTQISYLFPKNKIIGLLGPNGAGKTTLISILSGRIKKFEGEVKIADKNIKQDIHKILNILALVPQQIALYPTLTCNENLLYIGKLYSIPILKLKEKIAYYLNWFGLTPHRHKLIKHFSGGMQRRANLIASILHNPELLLLDEPTAGVDVQSRNLIIQFLKEYNAQGKTIIYTSHILHEAETICDEILLIDNGRKIIDGAPLNLIKQYHQLNLESLFLSLTGTALRDK